MSLFNNEKSLSGVTISKITEYYDSYYVEFKNTFGFYLQFLDRIYQIPIYIRIEDDIFLSLPDIDRQLLSFYRTLNDSAITTSIGALRLFSSNNSSDTFSLLRILSEILSLMSYGNKSRERKLEFYNAFVNFEIKGEIKNKANWDFLKKAKSAFINDFSGMKEVFDYINDFGSHASSKKIFEGNIANRNNVSISSFFQNNFHNRNFLLGLSFLASMLMNITIQYSIHYAEYNGVSEELQSDINNLTPIFSSTIQPVLIQMIMD